MTAPCTREYRHGPHTYNVVGVVEKAVCPGRKRRPVRAVLMLLDALGLTRALTVAFEWFMDRLVYPVYWLVFPGIRQHAREVKTQNDHLDGLVHVTPDPACWYCRARAESRGAWL